MTLIPDAQDVILRDEQIFRTSRFRPYRELEDVEFDFQNLELLTQEENLVLAQGIRAIRQWIQKALATESGAFPVYSENYGFDLWALIGRGLPPEAIQEIVPILVEQTLIYHPNIIGIESFSSFIEGDNLYAEWHTILDDEQIIQSSTNWVVR